jgi:hypothetical protein
MSDEISPKKSLKEKAIHELEEMIAIFLYLAFFFSAIVTYRMLLLNELHISYFGYGTALINALVVAKVILIGQAMHIGRKRESRPLFELALYKAFLFSVFVFVFHVVEELIRTLAHGEKIATALYQIRLDDMISRNLIVFCTFIPLFAFMELRRVLGEGRFWDLFFRTGEVGKLDPSTGA